MKRIVFSGREADCCKTGSSNSLKNNCSAYMYPRRPGYLSVTVILAVLLMFSGVLSAQKNATDALFDKYSGKEGFSSVYISSRMLGLFTPKEEGKELINRLSSIRILTAGNEGVARGTDLYTELGRNMDLSLYEELMVVKEAGQTTKFLILPKGERIAELLVISGGINDNSLISIKGDFDLKTLSGLSESTGISGLERLDSLEKEE